jgi:hypothetical protein
MLTCDECQQALAIIYFPQLSSTAYRKLTCLYEDQLSIAHKLSCSYRQPAACYVQSARNAAVTATAQGEPTSNSSSATSLSEVDILVPSVAAAAAAAPSPPDTVESPLIVPTLLENLFTREDLQLLDHAYPVRPFYSLVQSFHQHQQQLQDKQQQQQQQQQHHQPPLLQLQLPKVETTKTFLLYDPSRNCSKPGCENNHRSTDQKTLLKRLVDLLLRVNATSTGTGVVEDDTDDADDDKTTSWMKGLPPAHLESLVALVLLGWRPPAAATLGSYGSSSSSSTSGVVVSASCPVCGASISIELCLACGGSTNSTSDSTSQLEEQQRKKKRHRNNASSCNPVTGHKYYCPYVVGFPINGANEAKPLWQSMADRLLSPQQPNQNGAVLQSQGEEESGEKSVSSTQPGAWERISKMLASGIARKKDNIT